MKTDTSNTAEKPLVLSIMEAARLLGVSKNCAYEAANQGQLPSIRIGRRRVIPRIALERLVGLATKEGPSK
jgi:excisionase family DNA binding protein